MNLDRWCACGCRTPLLPGDLIHEVGPLRYAHHCVRTLILGDEKISASGWSAPTSPVGADPSALKV